MNATDIGLECLSGLGLPPDQLVELAAELDCKYVTLSLGEAPNRLPIYPTVSLRADHAMRRSVVDALRDCDVRVGMIEGFAIHPDAAPAFERDLDIAAELGARAICAVSLLKEVTQTCDAFARLVAMATDRGLITTTEVGSGALWRFNKAVLVAETIASPSFKLLIDTMHFFRAGASVADLASIDPALIGHVQLCDVPMPAIIPAYMEEALFERRAPGDGDLPLAEFLQLVPQGVIIGLEIPIRSQAEAGVGPRERLGKCVKSARAIMKAVS